MNDESAFADWESLGSIPGYRLFELIGQGFSSNVYRAIRLADEKPCAIKIFMESSNRQTALLRFEREWQVAQLLSNEHRVEVLEVNQTSCGLPALCMELIEGTTLQSHQRAGLRFASSSLLSLMIQLCEYLSELHQSGFTHGDIKPSNLMCVERPIETFHIKVLDLGLSREINQRGNGVHPPTQVDSQQLISGSPTYMAPELIAAPMICNPSSDIYALGCIGYELVSGQPPFVGNNVLQILSMQTKKQPAELASNTIDARLSKLIMSCLEKQIKDRPESAEELLRKLRALA